MKRRYLILLPLVGLLLLLQGCAFLEGVLKREGEEEQQSSRPLQQEHLLLYHQSGQLELLTLVEGHQGIKRATLLQLPHPVAWAMNEDQREMVALCGDGMGGRKIHYLHLAMPAKASGQKAHEQTKPIAPLLKEVGQVTPQYQSGRGHLAFSHDKVLLSSVEGHSIALGLIRKGQLRPADWYIDIAQSSPSEIASVAFSPDGKHLYVTDKGQRKSFHFRVNETIPPLTIDHRDIELQEGEVPLRWSFSKDMKHGYLLLEGGAIQHYRMEQGAMLLQETLRTTLPECDQIALDPKGGWLYAFGQGERKLLVCGIATDGSLTLVAEQLLKHPIGAICPSPTTQWVAVQYEGMGGVQLYRSDRVRGTLEGRGMQLTSGLLFGALWIE